MESNIVRVTPELAKAWIKSNSTNRGISSTTVRKYASDMLSGRWALNHQGIAFDPDGALADGQHRLNAVIQAGVPVDMMVTWGVTRTGIDELRPRSIPDIIKCGGMSDWVTRVEVETAKALQSIFVDNRAANYSAFEILDVCTRHKDAIIFSSELFAKSRKGVSVAAMRSVIAVASYHYDPDLLRRFVNILYTGLVQSKNEIAAIKLRDKLISGIHTNGAGSRKELAKIASRCVVAFNNGQELTKLYSQRELAFTVPD